jgi:hypothetical protein
MGKESKIKTRKKSAKQTTLNLKVTKKGKTPGSTTTATTGSRVRRVTKKKKNLEGGMSHEKTAAVVPPKRVSAASVLYRNLIKRLASDCLKSEIYQQLARCMPRPAAASSLARQPTPGIAIPANQTLLMDTEKEPSLPWSPDDVTNRSYGSGVTTSNRRRLLVDATRGVMRDNTITTRGRGEYAFFSSAIMQPIQTEKFGGGYDVSYEHGNVGYTVSKSSLEILLGYAMCTPEFAGAWVGPGISWFKDEMETYKGRPKAEGKNRYTKSINLWGKRADDNAADSEYQIYYSFVRTCTAVLECRGREPDHVETMNYLFRTFSSRNAKNGTFEKRDDVLTSDRSTTFGFYHFVTFLASASKTQTHSSVLFVLLGIFFRDMCLEKGAGNCIWERDSFGYDRNASPLRQFHWKVLAGLIELVLFQEYSNSFLNTLNFDERLFVSNPSPLFNTMLPIATRLKATYPNRISAYDDVERPGLYLENICPVTMTNSH